MSAGEEKTSPERKEDSSNESGSGGTLKEGGSVFKSKRRYNVEDLFKMMSSEKAHDLNRKPPPRQLFTPRSAEAFLKSGVDPELVKIRDLDSFWEPRLDPSLQRIHHEAYVANRHEFIDIVRRKYDQILTGDQKHRAQTASSLHDSPNKKTSATSTLVENEKKRLEKLRYRQEKEIQQMIAYEMKVARIQEEQNKKMMKEQARRERRKREELLRKKKNAELKRERQLKKKAQEDAEEIRRRMLAREQFVKEQQLVEAKKREEKRAKQEAREREIERVEKSKKHAMETARRFKDQQDRILDRMKEMKRSEARRDEYMNAMKERRHADLVKKRMMIEKRQHENKIAYRKRERKRLMEFRDRQRHNEDRRQRLEMEKHQYMLERQRLAELNERRRVMAVEDAHREEEERKQVLLDRQKEADTLLARMRAERNVKRRIRKEVKAMKRNQRFLTVQRKARIAEFQRKQTEKSLKEKANRVDRILNERQDLLRKRQQASIDAKRARDKVVLMMETIRLKKQWGDAEKIMKSTFAKDDDKAKRQSPRSRPTARNGGDKSHSKRHMENMNRTLPQLERRHKKASTAVAAMEMEMSLTRGGAEDSGAAGDREGANVNSFMSPYDIPQTVVLSKPYRTRIAKGKKNRRKKNRKGGKRGNRHGNAGSSGDLLLESLAQF
eukprot:g252.t1